MPDELCSAVVACWEQFPLDALARECVQRSQVTSALIANNDGDDFASNNQLHMNVCKCCVPVCDQDGKTFGMEILTSVVDNIDNEQPTLRHDTPIMDKTVFSANPQQMSSKEVWEPFHNPPANHKWSDLVTDFLCADELEIVETNLPPENQPSIDNVLTSDEDDAASEDTNAVNE